MSLIQRGRYCVDELRAPQVVERRGDRAREEAGASYRRLPSAFGIYEHMCVRDGVRYADMHRAFHADNFEASIVYMKCPMQLCELYTENRLRVKLFLMESKAVCSADPTGQYEWYCRDSEMKRIPSQSDVRIQAPEGHSSVIANTTKSPVSTKASDGITRTSRAPWDRRFGADSPED